MDENVKQAHMEQTAETPDEKMTQAHREAAKEFSEEIIPEPGEAEFSGGEEHLHKDGAEAADEPTEAVKSSELQALEEEKKSLIDRLSRLQADFDNFRKRTNQEKTELREWVQVDTLRNLLPVVDNFERALSSGQSEGENFTKGVEMIYRQLLSFLEKEGVTVIEAEGAAFDPEVHHAVIKEPGPEGVQEDTITQVLQKGYRLNNRILRPAMVKVAE